MMTTMRAAMMMDDKHAAMHQPNCSIMLSTSCGKRAVMHVLIVYTRKSCSMFPCKATAYKTMRCRNAHMRSHTHYQHTLRAHFALSNFVDSNLNKGLVVYITETLASRQFQFIVACMIRRVSAEILLWTTTGMDTSYCTLRATL